MDLRRCARRRCFQFASVVLWSFASAAQAQPPAQAAAEGFDPEVAAKWEEAQAESTWMFVSPQAELERKSKPPAVGQSVPTFEFRNLSEDGLKGLPAPQHGFGIRVWIGKLTEASMEQLATFENLQALSLQQVELTSTGINKLARLKNLKWLEINSGLMSDKGTIDLTGFPQMRWLKLSIILADWDPPLKGLAAR